MLDEALQAFFSALDRYTLADAVRTPTSQAIAILHRMSPRAMP